MSTEANPTTSTTPSTGSCSDVTSAIPPYKLAFLRTCLTHSILRFGTFTLKSGRVSPYFFNAGAFHTSTLLSSLSTAFAHTILTNLLHSPTAAPFDILFGPAYKGIPIACITALKLGELAPDTFSDLGYAFNRKEAKSHGEGGNIVGMPLRGKRVVVIDDVITAGTAIRESVEIIRQQGGTVVGIVVALDRMEAVREGDGTGWSAIAEVKREVGCGVWSVLNLEELVGAAGDLGVGEENWRRMVEYRKRYGAREV